MNLLEHIINSVRTMIPVDKNISEIYNEISNVIVKSKGSTYMTSVETVNNYIRLFKLFESMKIKFKFD